MTCGSPSVPSGSTERDSAVAPSGMLPAVAMKLPGEAQQRDVVERRLARHRRRVGAVVGGELEVEPGLGRRGRVRHREAVERLGGPVGGRHLEGPLDRLPAQHVDRLGVHVVEPDVAEPLGHPVDRPSRRPRSPGGGCPGRPPRRSSRGSWPRSGRRRRRARRSPWSHRRHPRRPLPRRRPRRRSSSSEHAAAPAASSPPVTPARTMKSRRVQVPDIHPHSQP